MTGLPPQTVSGTVVIGVRCGPHQPKRARNAVAVLRSLNRQTLQRSRYRIIVVEQDTFPRCRETLAPMADQYLLAFNPGSYNRGWGFNVGANLTNWTGILCLIDSDLLVPGDFLAECFERFAPEAPSARIIRALKPHSTIEYLDHPTSVELAAAAAGGACDLARFRGPAWKAVGGCICVEGGLYRELGGYDERFRGWGGEDRDFWLRLNQVTAVPILEKRLVHLDHERADECDDDAKRNRSLRKLKENGEDGWPTGPIGDALRYADELIAPPTPVPHEDGGFPVS